MRKQDYPKLGQLKYKFINYEKLVYNFYHWYRMQQFSDPSTPVSEKTTPVYEAGPFLQQVN